MLHSLTKMNSFYVTDIRMHVGMTFLDVLHDFDHKFCSHPWFFTYFLFICTVDNDK